jgi:hypothetical protein
VRQPARKRGWPHSRTLPIAALAAPRWARCIFKAEHFRSAVVVDSHCFHVLHFAHLLGQGTVKAFEVQVVVIEPSVAVYAESDSVETWLRFWA